MQEEEKGKKKSRAEEFLIRELNMSAMQAATMYKGYVEACEKYAKQCASEKIFDARIIVAKATNGTELGKKLDEELYKLQEG